MPIQAYEWIHMGKARPILLRDPDFPMIKSNEIQELTICWTTIEFA